MTTTLKQDKHRGGDVSSAASGLPTQLCLEAEVNERENHEHVWVLCSSTDKILVL